MRVQEEGGGGTAGLKHHRLVDSPALAHPFGGQADLRCEDVLLDGDMDAPFRHVLHRIGRQVQ